MEIWHNPRCTKSRNAKQALDDAGAHYTERRYLDQPPTEAQLREVLDKLGIAPWELARTGDPLAEELDLRALPHEPQVWIDTLVANPSLIQRPIIVTDDGRAVVARDEAAIQDALRSR